MLCGQTYDLDQTAEMIMAARSDRVFMPAMLAVLCGMRRGEIAALRWRNVDLAAAQLAVTESAEQTKAGVRYKEPKSGRGRTVALPGSLVAELRAHRVAQAQELLLVGRRLDDDDFVIAQPNGSPLNPAAVVKGPKPGHVVIATHLLASGVHPKVASERSGTARSGSRWTFTATSCRICRRTRLRSLTAL